MLSSRDILEHIESKASNNEPVDIDAKINKLEKPMNPEAEIPKYFQGLVDVQDKLKSTNEPQSDTTLKRYAKA